MYNLGMAMKKSSPEKEDKESIASNDILKNIATAQVVASVKFSLVDDGIVNEEIRHRSMIFAFPPQCEGPMSYQTIADDQVVHTDQDSSESERDSKSSTGSEQLNVSINICICVCICVCACACMRVCVHCVSTYQVYDASDHYICVNINLSSF